jgi:formylglycine-generating enzyme required for sulfatase activity
MWRGALLLGWAAAAVVLPGGRTTSLVARPPDRVVIPAGPFRMGASADQLRDAYSMCTDEHRAAGAELAEAALRCTARFDAEAPQRTVLLPAYAIDRTEVTAGAYRACVRARACDGTPLLFKAGPARGAAPGGPEAFPVEAVTWDEASAYCRWRGGRLPSEAEWEKAARGTLGATWPWGERWDGGRANHGRRARSADLGAEGGAGETDAADGYEGAAPAGSFPGGASPYGLLDAAGNLWEWTAGLYAREPPQSSSSFAPTGPVVGNERVLRGGSYDTPPSDLRATRRVPLDPGERHATVGFRCAYDR